MPDRSERCRPVTVEVDGEEITVSVLAEEEMSEEGRAALAAIVAAVKRKFASEYDEDGSVPGVWIPDQHRSAPA